MEANIIDPLNFLYPKCKGYKTVLYEGGTVRCLDCGNTGQLYRIDEDVGPFVKAVIYQLAEDEWRK